MENDFHTARTGFRPIGGAFLIEDTDPRAVFIPEDFGAEDRLIAKSAEDFLRTEVLPHTERIEAGDHALMGDLLRRAGALGLLGADVPEAYGGLGLKPSTAALVAEKLNFQQSFALSHEAHTVLATLPLLFFGNHDQKSRYLPGLATGEILGAFALSEANSGSDALAMQAKATLAPDGKRYLLSGVKMWITNSAFAQLFTVFARVEGDKITAFLVERDWPGVSFGKEERKLGMRGTSTRRLLLDNVAVPVGNVLEVGKGHYAAFCALNLGRFKLEAGAVGGLKEILAVCARYAGERRAFGHPLGDFGLIRHKLAEMAARTFALESMVYRLAGNLDAAFAAIDPGAPDAASRCHRAAEEYAAECAIVKVIGSEAYSHLADEAIQIHGGYGYTEDFPVARAWRDQRLLRIGEGANEIVRLAVVNTLLRRNGQGRLPLLDAGLRATETLLHPEVPEPPFYDDPLDEIGGAAKDAKRLALFLVFQAQEHLREALAEAEEIVAALADVIGAAYALDSVWLRCAKLQRRSSPGYDVALLAARVAARDHADAAVAAARYALDSLPLLEEVGDWRDEPFTGLSLLLDRLGRWEDSPMQLRRDLAARVIEREGYPL